MSSTNYTTLLVVGTFMIILACSFTGCTSYTGTSNAPTKTQSSEQIVIITDSGFNPSSITIKAGTTVTWTSDSQYVHSISSNFGNESDRFNSGTIAKGESYQHTYNQPGVYAYFDGMNHANTGTVKVV